MMTRARWPGRYARGWRTERRAARSLRARVLAWLSTEAAAALWRVLMPRNPGRKDW